MPQSAKASANSTTPLEEAPSLSTAAGSPGKKSTGIAAIVGGVAGGLAIVALVFGLMLLLKRSQAKKRAVEAKARSMEEKNVDGPDGFMRAWSGKPIEVDGTDQPKEVYSPHVAHRPTYELDGSSLKN